MTLTIPQQKMIDETVSRLDRGDMMAGDFRDVPTEAEAEFMELLDEMLPKVNTTEVLLEDDQGSWMIIMLNLTRRIPGTGYDISVKTLRLDYDVVGVLGGWSLSGMNGDVNLRAEHADVDFLPPDGINLSAADNSLEELAAAAAEWFRRHWDAWLVVRELPPKKMPCLARMQQQFKWKYPS